MRACLHVFKRLCVHSYAPNSAFDSEVISACVRRRRKLNLTCLCDCLDVFKHIHAYLPKRITHDSEVLSACVRRRRKQNLTCSCDCACMLA